MSLNTFAFSLKQRLRPGVTGTYRELMANQELSVDELYSLNWQRRKNILAYAFEKVPYYQQTLTAAGINPGDVKNEADWARLPVLSKETLRNNFAALIASQVDEKHFKKVTTGGSTGHPVMVIHDGRYPLEAIGWRLFTWWGVHPGDNAAYCWRLVRKTGFQRFMNAAMWWPTKRIWLDATSITERDVKKFIEEFNRVKPAFFQGYTGSIDFVAQRILANGIEIHSPKCVWGTSSPISSSQRINIETAFRAPLYDQYGCGEAYWLAAQCKERKGLHVFSDVRHIEFDSSGEGGQRERGDILLTDLVNYAFPLIRYKNGDRGMAINEKCPCGLNFPLIAPVTGRVTDMIRLPDGGAISGDYATTLFDDFPEAVRAFQVRQHKDLSLTILIVPASEMAKTRDALDKVGAVLASKTMGKLKIGFEFVEDLPSDRGKTRYIISEI